MTDKENTEQESTPPIAGKKRGPKPRSTSNMRPDEAQVLANHRVDDEFSHIKPVRGEERVAVGTARNLGGVEKYIKAGFKGYWEEPRRLETLANGGYSIVRDATGAVIRRPSGDSELILMEIPIDMWEADQKTKNSKAIDAMAEAATIDHRKGEYADEGRPQSVTATGTGTSPLYD